MRHRLSDLPGVVSAIRVYALRCRQRRTPAAPKTPVATKTRDLGSGTGVPVSPLVKANVYNCPLLPSSTAFSSPVGVKFTARRLAVNDNSGEIGGANPPMETSAKDVKSGIVPSTSLNTNPLKGAPVQPGDSFSMVMNPGPMSTCLHRSPSMRAPRQDR
jgi:hypothetical protein